MQVGFFNAKAGNLIGCVSAKVAVGKLCCFAAADYDEFLLLPAIVDITLECVIVPDVIRFIIDLRNQRERNRIG